MRIIRPFVVVLELVLIALFIMIRLVFDVIAFIIDPVVQVFYRRHPLPQPEISTEVIRFHYTIDSFTVTYAIPIKAIESVTSEKGLSKMSPDDLSSHLSKLARLQTVSIRQVFKTPWLAHVCLDLLFAHSVKGAELTNVGDDLPRVLQEVLRRKD